MSGTDAVIVGGGLAGLSAAFFLRQRGYGVTVVECEADVALGTSFANGGMVTPSMSEPWNSPGVYWKLLKWIGRDDAPMLLRLGAVPRYSSWGLRFLANSAPAAHERATAANLALSVLSLQATRKLRIEQGLNYDAGTKGTMKLFRDPAAFHRQCAVSEQLRCHGLDFKVLDPAGCVRTEPVLSESEHALVGGIHFPDDETGNAQLFCRELKRVLVGQGVRFVFNTAVAGLAVERRKVVAVETASGSIAADCVVVAAAAKSRLLLAPHGVRIGVMPVKGYSVSTMLTDAGLMPSLALVDDEVHICATPLGRTLRVAGTAEFCGWNPDPDPTRVQALWDFLESFSPRLSAAADRNTAQSWCGFRPMAADGRPYIGATPIAGLYVNTGHGHLGFTQAAGSGQLLAELMAGEAPSIDPRPYAVGR